MQNIGEVSYKSPVYNMPTLRAAAVPLAVTSRPLHQLCPWGGIGHNKSRVLCWMINRVEEGPAEELRLEESKARGPMKAQVEDLRKQLKAKSRIIQSLKEEIKTPLFQNAQKKNEILKMQNKMQIIVEMSPLVTGHEDAAGRQDDARVNLCSSQRNTTA
ncbi:unnamed protein product [Leuciscus chuanchicus]